MTPGPPIAKTFPPRGSVWASKSADASAEVTTCDVLQGMPNLVSRSTYCSGVRVLLFVANTTLRPSPLMRLKMAGRSPMGESDFHRTPSMSIIRDLIWEGMRLMRRRNWVHFWIYKYNLRPPNQAVSSEISFWIFFRGDIYPNLTRQTRM
jgi:hypothetical protein